MASRGHALLMRRLRGRIADGSALAIKPKVLVNYRHMVKFTMLGNEDASGLTIRKMSGVR